MNALNNEFASNLVNLVEVKTFGQWFLCFVLLCGVLDRGNDCVAQVPVIRSLDEQLSAGPLCGVYALMAAARCHSIDVDPDDLLDSRFVGSRKGSSALDLCNAASEIGLNAEVIKNGSVGLLTRSGFPMILHLNRSRDQTTSRHWVLYLGDQDGKARILDAAEGMVLRNYADLLAEWDGVAVEVNGPGGQARQASVLNRLPIFRLLVVLGLLCAVATCQFTGVSSKLRLSHLSMVTMLIGVTVVVSNIFHWVSPIGMHRCRSATALVTKFHFAKNLPTVSAAEIAAMLNDPEKSSRLSFVDARLKPDFEAGHIPNAISLPVDSSPESFSRAVDQLQSSDQVIVYCQSVGCRWDETVASHLVFAGLKNVSLFTGGWMEWKEMQQ